MPAYKITIEYQTIVGQVPQAEFRLSQPNPSLPLKKLVFPGNFTATPAGGGWSSWSGNLDIAGAVLRVSFLLDVYDAFPTGLCRVTINDKLQPHVLKCSGEGPDTLHDAFDYPLNQA